ncbi:CLUMA_CG007408, isoform A [Clunio marinus]|uniref:CLUMA_CG007408, isoform A n=1 Tax=Clunio marinus TaxID=568069 RepID=A0A1J1I662_9DIPT|nr:CLUMA_CG007408, isoform A [Clunio marinus]
MLMTLLISVNVQAENLKLERNLRIVGGQVARPGQFPHAAALILHLTLSRSSFCGGNIIHQNYILTAAHCLDDITRVEVLAGVHNIWRNADYREMVEPRDIRKHPQYNQETLLNDIGLVFLLQRIPLNSGGMQRIALPPRNHMTNRFVGSTGTIIGWGRTSDTSVGISDVLRFVTLPIIADQQCIDTYNTNFNYFNPTNMCISGARGSSCNGDSGSGMHLNINGQMTLIGLVSYGSSTCESGHPPVMTRVTSYLEWIAANTGIRLM